MMTKKTPLLSITLFLLSITIFWSCSDKGLGSSGSSGSFEGKVTYSLDFQLPPKRQQMAAMFPDQELVYLKDGKSRLERQLSMGLLTVLIYDPARDSMVQLLDPKGSMGGRIGRTRVPMPIDTSGTHIEYLDKKDTLTVLEVSRSDDSSQVDYVCKKAIVRDTIRGEAIEMPVWYTEELQGQPFRQFRGLKGLPLKFKSESNGYTVEKEVRKIERMKVADSLFNDHPKGYTTRSMKELKQLMQGGGR